LTLPDPPPELGRVLRQLEGAAVAVRQLAGVNQGLSAELHDELHAIFAASPTLWNGGAGNVR
jgi:hypothetical protein